MTRRSHRPGPINHECKMGSCSKINYPKFDKCNVGQVFEWEGRFIEVVSRREGCISRKRFDPIWTDVYINDKYPSIKVWPPAEFHYNRYVIGLLSDANFVLFSCSLYDVWQLLIMDGGILPRWTDIFPRWVSQFEVDGVDCYHAIPHALFGIRVLCECIQSYTKPYISYSSK